MSPLPQTVHITARVVVKALILFVIANILFAIFYPLPLISKLSLYNHIFPGRTRLPYGDDPSRAYNLSLFNLEAMFASHLISDGDKPADEYRVLLIGDSQTWGYLLEPQQTLSSTMNNTNLQLPDGKKVRVYNLAYPVMSLTKDMLILSKALDHQPDLIVWLVTLESFPYNKQLFPPLLQHNPQSVRDLIQRFDLNLDPQDPGLVDKSPWERTMIGSRRDLADMIRLQILGVLWAGTLVDQDIPQSYPARLEDLPADDSFHDLLSPLNENILAFDVLQAGIDLAGDIPVLVVNEPMFISKGQNSDIRYNFYYPRWAYDNYRYLMTQKAEDFSWNYLDLWDALPASEFTNTAVHLTPYGVKLLAERLQSAILELSSSQP
jgi:hypothetical protein